MDPIILTPRLKLTLVTAAELGSSEFEWIHELRSNEQSAWWSLYGPSKSLRDTETALKNILPVAEREGKDEIFRFAYAVHEIIIEPSTDINKAASNMAQGDPSTRFIGLISLRSLSATETSVLPRLGHASTPTTLSLEVAYMFLPTAWGRGYATESINAVFDACNRAKECWQPFQKVYVRAIVNDENRPSQRVMEKCGMGGPEIMEFEDGRFFIAGKWRERHRLCIFGKMVVE